MLIVDDEEDVIAALQFRLTSAGYEVITAGNGAAALKVIQSSDIDLVKEDPKLFDVKILLFSCNTEPEFRRRAIELGAIDYLAKTDGANSIVARVYDVVGPEKATARTAEAASDGSAVEEALRLQVKALAQNLTDVLHLAQMDKDMPQSAQYALDSAHRIAEDMLNLAGAVQGKGVGEKPAKQTESPATPSNTR